MSAASSASEYDDPCCGQGCQGSVGQGCQGGQDEKKGGVGEGKIHMWDHRLEPVTTALEGRLLLFLSKTLPVDDRRVGPGGYRHRDRRLPCLEAVDNLA